jgi:hypothetical protein
MPSFQDHPADPADYLPPSFSHRKDFVKVTPEELAEGWREWDVAAADVDHLIRLVAEHRIDCPNPLWCTDNNLINHLNARHDDALRALLLVAVTRLALRDD